MKKVFSLLAVLALVCMAGTAFALDPVTKAAVATFGDAPALELSVTVHSFGTGVSNYSNVAAKTGTNADIIEFNVPASGFPFASDTTTTIVGKDFFKVHSNIAQQTSGHIILVTDNVNSTNYQAKASRGDEWGTYRGGLVRSGMGTAYNKGDLAPIKTLIVSVSSATANFASAYPTAQQFNTLETWKGCRPLVDLSDVLNDPASQQEKYYKYKYQLYLGLAGANNGHWISGGYNYSEGGDLNGYTTEDVVIFLSADFTKVTGGDTYGTDQIKFISYNE